MSIEFEVPHKLYIAGQWRDAVSGKTFAVNNPANGSHIADVPLGDDRDATQAVQAAQQAFEGWAATPPPKRSQFLRKVHDLLLANRQAIGRLLTAEQGKPLPQALAEVDYAASFYLWFAEEARRLAGRGIPHVEPDRSCWVEYHPVGVIAAVTPWNFPLAQGAKKLAAALAAGCTAVLKPASHTPLVSLAMAWIAQQAQLPAGVLNVVCGQAGPIGKVFCEHDAVRVISLTGATQTGAELMSNAGRSIKRTAMELGGNCPFIVLQDADLDLAADDLVRLKFMANGQMCVTANRVFVHESIAQQMTQRLLPRVRGLRLGDGLTDGVDVGPLISDSAVRGVDAMVRDSVRAGAKLLCGGLDSLPSGLPNGHFYPPTLLGDVHDDMRIAREEIFGPVIPLLTFKDEDEAVRRANDTEYGLAAYVYSRDANRATAIARRVQAGIVGINEMRPLRAEVPFGGLKRSGIGREGGTEGMLEFTEARVFSLREPHG